MDTALSAVAGGVAGLLVSVVSHLLQTRETNKRERRQVVREAYSKFAGLFFEYLTENALLVATNLGTTISGQNPLLSLEYKDIALKLEGLNVRLHEAEAVIYMAETNKSALDKFQKVIETCYPQDKEEDVAFHHEYRLRKIGDMKAFLSWRAQRL